MIFQGVVEGKLVDRQVVFNFRLFDIPVKDGFDIDQVVYLHTKTKRVAMVQSVCFHLW